MGIDTGISWTTHTYNPWWGCTKVSAGCDHCYADTLASRYGHDIWGAGKERRYFGDKHWSEPLKWNRDAAATGRIDLVFCGSMCDVMDAEVDDKHRAQLWELIEATSHLHWQLLTKRPNLINIKMPKRWLNDPPANVWWGTSVESNDVLWRVKRLALVPAAVRFLSIEPMIGDVHLPACDGQHISWLIYGGESGPGARPMDIDWLRHGVVNGRTYGQAVFVKQMGSVLAKSMGLSGKGDDPTQWPEWCRVQEFPQYYHDCLAAVVPAGN